MEFKFDDTRLSYWHKNKIGRIEIFLLLSDFANFLTCWLAQFCWDSQQGRELAKSGSNKKKIKFCQCYSYVNKKVWYDQIWIPNNLGFIVSDLLYIYAYGKIMVFKSVCTSFYMIKNQVWCGKLLKGLTFKCILYLIFITLECSLRQEQMSYLINCMAKLH